MSFLTAADYGPQIKQDQLDIVLQGNATALPLAELSAQEYVESFLRQRYDVAEIFAATGTARSALIITYMVDIALYTVHSRHGRVAMPEKRIAAGKISANLPALPVAEAPGRFKWGSAPTQQLSW
jgi:hypothetical protein